MKYYLLIAASCFTIGCSLYINTDEYVYTNTLTWFEEFNNPQINTDIWNFDQGNTGWGNNEWQNYTNSSSNAFIENGMLIIQANYNGNGLANGNFTSARLQTKGTFEFKYGKIEARIMLPKGQGIWPAFWMLGSSFPEEAWPDCGEIDIMENLGKDPSKIYGTIHGPGYSGMSAKSGSSDITPDEFHVYSVLWEPNTITWYIDGSQYFQYSQKRMMFWERWRHDQPYFLLLNLAVGGNWPGYPDSSTVFPQKMRVDWIRLYQ